jgi:hypothetical protein
MGKEGWEAKLSKEDHILMDRRIQGVLPDGWVQVPDKKIIRETNPDDSGIKGHLCINHYTGEVLCSVPPTGVN